MMWCLAKCLKTHFRGLAMTLSFPALLELLHALGSVSPANLAICFLGLTSLGVIWLGSLLVRSRSR